MHATTNEESEKRRAVLSTGQSSVACLLVCGMFSAVAFGVWSFDDYLSNWARTCDLPGDIRKLIDLSEAFAHGSGATLILLAVFLSSKAKRPILAIIILTAFSGVLANISKAGFVRIRPHSAGQIEVVSQAEYDQIQSTPGTSSQAPELVVSDFGDSRQRSFPSGHTATAWALAIGLALVYPRGALVFLLLALLASFQRIYSGAHYPSDVLAGAAIAWGCTALILPQGWFRSLLKAEGH